MSKWISADYLLGKMSLRKDGVLTKHDIEFAPYAEFGWIPVSERLPEDTLPRFSEVRQFKVLVVLKSYNGIRTVRSQTRYKDTWGKETRWMWKHSSSIVTHWMPLPEPPQEKDNGNQ